MTNSTRNILRIVSIVLVIAMVLMELGVIPVLFNYRFWFMILAYGLLLFTMKR